MLYRIVGEEISTRRHVDIPNLDAPDIATARQFATEIGIVVSSIEPMDIAQKHPTSWPLLIASLAVGLVLLALVLTYVGLTNHRPEAPTGYQPSHVGNRVDAALPEWKRREIFFELAVAQDAGDSAYSLLAQKYGVSKETVFQIAGEGAAKKWPVP